MAFSFFSRVFSPRLVVSTPLIVDACLLFNELDLLEIRLGELWDTVGRFVIVESDRTFAGRPKPYFFEAQASRFKPFASKISYHKVRGLKAPARMSGLRTTTDARFKVEAAQRDAVGTALAQMGLRANDIVVLSDVDEIPRPALLAGLHERLAHKAFSIFVLHNYRGYVNNLSDKALNGAPFLGSVACHWKTMRRIGAHQVRAGGLRSAHVAQDRVRRWDYVEDGGWHLSSLGGAEAFWVKAQNFSHVEDPNRVAEVPDATQPLQVFEGALSREECTQVQQRYLASGGDFHFSPLAFDEFSIEQDVPAYLRDHKERFRRFFFFTDLTIQRPSAAGG
ncbi:MAG TPA: hypothetical protein VGJ31_12050 [Dongiaceae bacterium]